MQSLYNMVQALEKIYHPDTDEYTGGTKYIDVVASIRLLFDCKYRHCGRG